MVWQSETLAPQLWVHSEPQFLLLSKNSDFQAHHEWGEGREPERGTKQCGDISYLWTPVGSPPNKALRC